MAKVVGTAAEVEAVKAAIVARANLDADDKLKKRVLAGLKW